ncbi:hypothetical protein HYU22_02830 [Candidatus Woesearchaeota archaeon]|nr:hypothetical protein [Candidatus Woesearchaeota archaeon]
MPSSSTFLRVYLYLTLIFGIIGLVDNIFTFLNFMPPMYVLSILGITVLFFIFNITTIPLFMHQRVPRIAFVLPVYHVLSFLVFFGIGVALFVFELAGEKIWVWGLIGLGFLASLFEIIFSLYLLRKFSFTKAVALPSGQTHH